MHKHIFLLVSLLTIGLLCSRTTNHLAMESPPFVDNEGSSLANYGDSGLGDYYDSQDFGADAIQDQVKSLHNEEKMQNPYIVLGPDNNKYNVLDKKDSAVSVNEISKLQNLRKRKRGGKFHKPDGRIRLLKTLM